MRLAWTFRMVTFRTFEQRAFGAVLLLATLWFLYLIHNFLQPIFWAALLATLFSPLHVRLLRRLRGHASLCAALMVLLIVVSAILPVLLVALAAIHQSSSVFQSVPAGSGFAGDSLHALQRILQPLQIFLDRFGIDLANADHALASGAAAAGEFMATHALAFGQNALLFAVQFMTMLYLLFFFVRDGASLIARLIEYLPMGDARERRLIAKFSQMATATVKGTLVVACVQGTLGGLAFWILGVPGAVLWGSIMMVLGLVPVAGAALVWLPAAFWLMATGASGKALGLVLFGIFVIELVDNFLRPRLVGRDTHLPDYLVLVATFGGIAVLGASGFVIGPIAAALCVAGWSMFRDDIGKTA